jgi:7-dehydrocholesterol reductase
MRARSRLPGRRSPSSSTHPRSWHIASACDGSVAEFGRRAAAGGLPYLAAAYPRPSWDAVRYVAAFGGLQAALMLAVPGRRFLGPATPRGNVPVYVGNGVQCYALTLALFFLGWHYQIFSPAAVYDALGAIVSTLNLFSFALCAALTVKGLHFPSSSDSGTTGSLLFDFYWGTELFPRIGSKFDIKVWTNCRMGMMAWAVLPLCYAAKQAAVLGAVSPSMAAALALVELYVFKFFVWETGCAFSFIY